MAGLADQHETTDVVVIGAGQSGLSAARALLAHGITPVVLEAGPEPAGSWPCYYDSVREPGWEPHGRTAWRRRERARTAPRSSHTAGAL